MNLALSLILIQSMGIVGVALGTAIPQFIVMTVLLPILVNRKVDFSMTLYLRNVYFLPLLASIPFAFVTWYMNQYFPTDSLLEFFSQVAAGLLVYFMSVVIISLSAAERVEYFGLARKFLSGKSS